MSDQKHGILESVHKTLFSHAASILARQIHANLEEKPDGTIAWKSAVHHELSTRKLRPGQPVVDGYLDLYSGNPGIAIFFAAHWRIVHDAISRETCLRAIQPIRKEIQRCITGTIQEGRLKSMPIGALAGTASLLYAFLKIGQLISDPALIEEAHAMSSLLTPEKIKADQHFDLVFGSAGAILVLLALERSVPGKNAQGYTPLELANLCACQLLNSELYRASDRQKSKERVLKTGGLSHGTAGVSLALLRLYLRTGEPLLREHARNLLTLMDDKDDSDFTWCHGRTGIILALTELLEIPLPNNEKLKLLDKLNKALTLLASAPHGAHDHICCGNMGRISILAHVARQMRDRRLEAEAFSLAVQSLRIAKTKGDFLYDYKDSFEASLFRGAAGIGYTLLALSEPGRLPEILALE
jgi:lantibiotic modifying enzyme